MGKRVRQRRFAEIDDAWLRADIPKHVTVIGTADKTIEQVVEAMMAVPLDKSILLDFEVGRGRGRHADLSDEQLDLLRLAHLLNSRYHGRRFDWLGDDPIAQMVRTSVRDGLWRPRLQG